MKVIVTGSSGFIGKNLVVALRRQQDVVVGEYDLGSTQDELMDYLRTADEVFHLAGVNRPERTEEYEAGNAELTRQLCDMLRSLGRKPAVVLSSSTQAALDSPYGVSKRRAEEAVFDFGSDTGARVCVFRLPGVFGKWCRPNYNSVVATFCYNIARDLPITISDPGVEIDLAYIDDVVATLIDVMNGKEPVQEGRYSRVEPTYKVTLGDLATIVQAFRESRVSLQIPDMSDRFTRCLYSTYLSYLPTKAFAYELQQRADRRGELAEFLKSHCFGQLFLSRTRPGICRGNHYHDTKVEKFAIIEGDALIRFRSVLNEDVIEYRISGREFRVVDIPPGYAHSIENLGEDDLIVLFWASDIFDPGDPDTHALEVCRA